MSDIGEPMKGEPNEVAAFLINIGDVLDKTHEFINEKFVNVVTIDGNVFIELYGIVRLKLEDMPTLIHALNVTMINSMSPPGEFDMSNFANGVKSEE